MEGNAFAASGVMRHDPHKGRHPIPVWDEPGGLPTRYVYEKPAELRNAKPRVWPSEQWFDENLGIRDPRILDKYGQMQSALYSFADGVTMGIPSAIAKRFAPDTMRGVDEVTKSHPYASGASNVGGFIAGPAGQLVRAAGNAVAKRGGSIYQQAAADGASAAGLTIAPSALSGDIGYSDPRAASGASGAASIYRLIDQVPDQNAFRRVAKGALAGVIGGAPEAAMTGSSAPLVAGMAMGMPLASSMRGQARPAKHTRERWDYDGEKADGRRAAEMVAQIAPAAGAVQIGSMLYGMAQPDPPAPQSKDWWNSTKDRGRPLIEMSDRPSYDNSFMED